MTRRLVTVARTDGPCASRDQPPPPPYCCPYPCPYCTLPLLKQLRHATSRPAPASAARGLRAARRLPRPSLTAQAVAHARDRGARAGAPDRFHPHPLLVVKCEPLCFINTFCLPPLRIPPPYQRHPLPPHPPGTDARGGRQGARARTESGWRKRWASSSPSRSGVRDSLT